ncbi:3-deoxy-7-phosphoheptulonate synthase [Cystobasidium minutum MCA 4210]|uniref:3-deoxy-7-phosphoheptulonate synthase n=1 Tax=Cystobasidium minutum MCA 4210 TaxID=1397322 RepID=UPI0034CE60FC|eukprot:jgi/Rhomi1/86785/CE86784_2725
MPRSEVHGDDIAVEAYDVLVPPGLLKQEYPLTEKAKATIQTARNASMDVIDGVDDRVLVIVGPCSIHDAAQGLEYGRRLKEHIPDWPNLVVLMRCYFEKPRTTVGWKGLINDPDLTQKDYNINKGLKIARKLLVDLAEAGVPVGCELLDTISPQFLSDTISWGAIGARTTESQLHRELASGVSFPIGFKNATSGSVGIAIDAMRSASNPHAFMGINPQGLAAIVRTHGNPHVHVILRGSSDGPNYKAEYVKSARDAMLKARKDFHPSIMIDCSHGNSEKNHNNQPKVLADICTQLQAGDTSITGVMIEGHFNAGRQDVPPEGPSGLKYGVSVTDACCSFDTTIQMLNDLNKAVGERRNAKTNGSA